MRLKLVVLVLLIGAWTCNSGSLCGIQPPSHSEDLPDYCHGRPCPVPKVLNQTDAYETRRYGPEKWVALPGETSKFEISLTRAFTELLRYIKGNNVEAVSMDMTAPIAVWCTPKDDFKALERNFTVAAYLPSRFQDKPPKPKNPRLIFLKEPRDESIVYVRSFGGFAIEGTVLDEAKALSEALYKDDLPHEKRLFVYAAYDTPERLTGRHNEVIMWPPKKKETISDVRILSASRDTGEALKLPNLLGSVRSMLG